MDKDEAQEEQSSAERKGTARPRPRTRRPAAVKTAPVRSTPPQEEEAFLSKDDLSRFFSIKPYLSEKGQAIVDLLAEVGKSGGSMDPAFVGRLLGMAGGGKNLGALAPLLGLAGSAGGGASPGGKLDPSALLPLLTNLAGQGGGKLDAATLLPLLTALATQNKQEKE